MAIKFGSIFNDHITGTNQDDKLFGLAGNDKIKGKAGNDLIDGGRGNDLLQGGDGVDTLKGGRGKDTLIGDKGNDKIFGGRGNDLLIWNNGDGSDLMNGGKGYDTVQVNGAVDKGDNFLLKADGHQAIFKRVNLGQFQLTVDDVEKFEINGGGGDDKFTVKKLGTTDVKTVVFNGGKGHDVLDATQADLPIIAKGGQGNDTLKSGSGNDILRGERGNDWLSGGDGVDELRGGRGKDTLIGDKGNDKVFGGRGNDLLIWNNGDGSDLMNGGAGYDTVQVNGANGPGDQFLLKANGNQALFQRQNLGLFQLDIKNVERMEINGQKGNDILNVKDLSHTGIKRVDFNGGQGDDKLNASQARQTIYADGGKGHDRLIGGYADDRIAGGRGNDKLTGNGGSDRFVFEGDVSFKHAGLGRDIITDFEVGTDRIVLDKTVFNQLAVGALDAHEFDVVDNGQQARLSNALITYNRTNGNLYYNANRSDAGFGHDGGIFATLQPHAGMLGNHDLVVKA